MFGTMNEKQYNAVRDAQSKTIVQGFNQPTLSTIATSKHNTINVQTAAPTKNPQSPEKQTLNSSARRRDNSNSSRGSSGNRHSHSHKRSGSRLSYSSTDPDSQEKAFVYPC